MSANATDLTKATTYQERQPWVDALVQTNGVNDSYLEAVFYGYNLYGTEVPTIAIYSCLVE